MTTQINMTTQIKLLITYENKIKTGNKYITYTIQRELPSPDVHTYTHTCQHRVEYETALTLKSSDNAKLAPTKAIVQEANKIKE